jgi:RNA polymerase sigma-70 factor (ECF subfamily)
MITRRKPSQLAIRDVPPASDSELVSRLAQGEIAALGELYDRYHAPLRKFVSRATSGADDVDDLVHATFLTAMQIAARYDGRACCRPWLIGIAAQLVRRRRQALGRWFALRSSLSSARSVSVDPRPAFQAQRDLERALAHISEIKRITFLMAEVERLSCEEIAQALEVPVGTVWTRLHAARRELRAALAEGEP